jgi:hypothetical protein
VALLHPQAPGSSGTSGVPFPVPTIVGRPRCIATVYIEDVVAPRTDPKENAPAT